MANALHWSCISPNATDVARENNILPSCLPPYTTHILQPLDMSVYKPLKNHFSGITHFIILANVTPNEKINKTNFHEVFQQNIDNHNF